MGQGRRERLHKAKRFTDLQNLNIVLTKLNF